MVFYRIKVLVIASPTGNRNFVNRPFWVKGGVLAMTNQGYREIEFSQIISALTID